jgi:hypothetical protein
VAFNLILSSLWTHLERVLHALGGRRFLLSVGAGAFTTLLCWYGKIDGIIYRDVILGTVGAYIAGNVVQKVKGASDVPAKA